MIGQEFTGRLALLRNGASYMRSQILQLANLII
jgi:hypothetical protein